MIGNTDMGRHGSTEIGEPRISENWTRTEVLNVGYRSCEKGRGKWDLNEKCRINKRGVAAARSEHLRE